MQHILHTFDQNRKNIITLLEDHSLVEVNTIPPGINNNIIWNAGHLLLSQQFVIYHFSDLPMLDFVQELIPKFGSGSKPDGKTSQTKVDSIIDQLKTTTDKVISDYNNGIFKTYNEYTSEYYHYTMRNIKDAIHFNTYHEGYHFGYMSAIRNAIR